MKITNFLFSVSLLLLYIKALPDYQNQFNWGLLCKNGLKQSPINIFPKAIHSFSKNKINIHFKEIQSKIFPSIDGGLKSRYVDSTIHIILSTGYNIRYISKQYIVHVPAEHRIRQQGDLELEVIYQMESKSKKYYNYTTAIVSILFKQVTDNSDQNTVFHNLQLSSLIGQANFGQTIGKLIQQQQFFTYIGSQTTPFCKQNIERYVSAKLFPIKKYQLQQLKNKVNKGKPNNRRVQRLNGRMIKRIKNEKFEDLHKNRKISKGFPKSVTFDEFLRDFSPSILNPTIGTH